ncbi:MAG: hypothetical protein HY608_06475 [Planctomycetes bacterium]|nr:hypothetical protein [Planctomycetota bacterium]
MWPVWVAVALLAGCACRTAATLVRVRRTHAFLRSEPPERLVAYLAGGEAPVGYDPDRSSSFSLNVILELSRRGDERVVGTLVEMLSSRHYQERKFALQTLHDLTGGGADEAIGEFAQGAGPYREWWERNRGALRWDPARRCFRPAGEA